MKFSRGDDMETLRSCIHTILTHKDKLILDKNVLHLRINNQCITVTICQDEAVKLQIVSTPANRQWTITINPNTKKIECIHIKVPHFSTTVPFECLSEQVSQLVLSLCNNIFGRPLKH